MAKVSKPNLDEATIQIARRMLNTPPKPHDKMKVGKLKPQASQRKVKAATPSR